MPYLILCLTIAIALFVRAPVHAQDLTFDAFRGDLDALRVQASIPGLSVAVVGTKDILWEHAFGEQDLQRAVATRTDTPFHLDGVTQVLTASLVLRCVEEGQLLLDDKMSQFTSDSPDASANIHDVLTHTTASADGLRFTYRPERLEPLSFAVRTCTGESFRETLGKLLDRLGMRDSVPGPDAIHVVPTTEYDPPIKRYRNVLARLATPYAADPQGRSVASRYPATTLTPVAGLISTVRDFAKFDLALRNGILLRDETLALAWRPPIGHDGQPLPHGLGWFVQTYNGEPVVWQFGLGEDASSSLVAMVPERGLTMILMANSDGLAKPFALAAGDLTVSPFARLFLDLFVR